MGIRRSYRGLFRRLFPHRSETDFPGGYIPNRFFLEHIDKGPVLVVGDYKGRDYSVIKKKIPETYLLDIVDNGVAEKDFFIYQSITEPISFPDHHFRYAVIAEVIEHVWEDKQALVEVRRVLSPEGKLLLTAPLLHDFPDHHFHIYSPKSLEGILKFSGFSIEERYYRGLLVAIPNEVVACAAVLLYPFFGVRALSRVNAFFYRMHKIIGRSQMVNGFFRFHRVLKGYGMLLVAKKNRGPLPDPIEIQRESFCA
jgi:SAM-dependent methyltransferase